MGVVKDSRSALVTFNNRGRTSAEPNEYSLDFIRFAASSRLPVLDIGAAFGVATLPALLTGAHVVANDIDPRHLQVIAASAPAGTDERLTLLPGRFPQEIDFEDDSLGAVLASNVFNFLSSEEIVIGVRKILCWLEPGGKAYVVAGTPYAANVKEFIPVYERRKALGKAWPGEVTDISKFSEHETLAELPKFLHLLDAEVLNRVFSDNGFIVDRVEMYKRKGLPEYLRFDGRENVGLIATKP